MDLLAQPTLRTNAEAVADDEHPDHQLRINRGPPNVAIVGPQMSRPGQRFVPVRSIDNQAELMRHRTRELLAGQRTAALNALRGHLAELSGDEGSDDVTKR
jgi:hypothetical protein